MKRLSLTQVKAIHAMLIIETDGVAGIRDESLLDSAMNAPFKTFDGEDVYRGLEAKAARLGYGIIHARPFVDGNKRTAMLAMLTFLLLNGVWLHCGDEDIVETGIELASGDMTQGLLLKWIEKHR